MLQRVATLIQEEELVHVFSTIIATAAHASACAQSCFDLHRPTVLIFLPIVFDRASLRARSPAKNCCLYQVLKKLLSCTTRMINAVARLVGGIDDELRARTAKAPDQCPTVTDHGTTATTAALLATGSSRLDHHQVCGFIMLRQYCWYVFFSCRRSKAVIYSSLGRTTRNDNIIHKKTAVVVVVLEQG